MSSLCECGCGETVVEGRRFRQGHWSRSQANKEMRAGMRRHETRDNPSGLCQCGCGQPAPLAAATKSARGYVAGEPLRFLPGHQLRGRNGKVTSRWRGGRWTHKAGYVYVYRPDHPHKNAHGYVYEHRVVMEEKLGRLLTPDERVHHINNVKDDNRPENLELFATQGEHSRLHEGQRKRAKEWERAIVAVLLDDELLERTRAYVRQHNRLPDLDTLTS